MPTCKARSVKLTVLCCAKACSSNIPLSRACTVDAVASDVADLGLPLPRLIGSIIGSYLMIRLSFLKWKIYVVDSPMI
jgi:hypothetical protein